MNSVAVAYVRHIHEELRVSDTMETIGDDIRRDVLELRDNEQSQVNGRRLADA